MPPKWNRRKWKMFRFWGKNNNNNRKNACHSHTLSELEIVVCENGRWIQTYISLTLFRMFSVCRILVRFSFHCSFFVSFYRITFAFKTLQVCDLYDSDQQQTNERTDGRTIWQQIAYIFFWTSQKNSSFTQTWHCTWILVLYSVLRTDRQADRQMYRYGFKVLAHLYTS